MSVLEEQSTHCPNIFHSACKPLSASEESEEGVACPLCRQEKSVAATHKRIKSAARKMLETSRKKIPDLKEGDNVLLAVPKVDERGADRADARQFQANQRTIVSILNLCFCT